MEGQLFVQPRRSRWTGTRALACRLVCPHCEGSLMRMTATQLPLFRHGGYGEAVMVVYQSCRCTSRVSEIRAVNPRR